MSNETTSYGQSHVQETGQIEPPELEYRPALPYAYRPKIGLVGAGGVTEYHLREYQKAGLDVVAIGNRSLEKAQARRDEFFPNAEVYDDCDELIARDDIEVIDIATPADSHAHYVEFAIRSGKHVLCQKPFVLDIDQGEELVALADEYGVKLAVNQNGRWAPHFSYLNQVIQAGLIGTVESIDFVMQFDHTWTEGTRFEELPHLMLFDFGIHWFDIATVFMNNKVPYRVYASETKAAHQTHPAPLLAHAVADYDHAQVRINLNGNVSHGQQDRTIVAGSKGTILATGSSLSEQDVICWTKQGWWEPDLRGSWFTNGFLGTMADLLVAVEHDRDPFCSARSNLKSLEFSFAAIRGAEDSHAEVPGQFRRASGDD